MSTGPALPPHRHGAGAPLCDVSAARESKGARPHVVIVGAGFGGLSATKALAKTPVSVTVIDRRNHHLFQPLLYQVATAGLSPAEIAYPIRSILSQQKNATVLLGEVMGVDKEKREVILADQRILYDYLVLATGARHAYFGHHEWETFAPGLKSLEHATEIRRRVLLSFERAEVECDADERRRLMTFAIIGAGPTGVEMAGAIAEIARYALASDFRNIDPRSARVVLIEAGPRILPTFPETLSSKAHAMLTQLGAEIRLGVPVTACDDNGVVVGAEHIYARTVIWAAGVMASPAARWLGVAADRAGRVAVCRDLSVPGHDNIFVIGDTAAAMDAAGKPLPGLAPVAKQQGQFVAHLIERRVAGHEPPPAFSYRNGGNLATIGRRAAVADFGAVQLSGFFAWVLWSVAHIYFLIGFRSRITVSFQWLWAYSTYQRGARLITGATTDAPPQFDASATPIRLDRR